MAILENLYANFPLGSPCELNVSHQVDLDEHERGAEVFRKRNVLLKKPKPGIEICDGLSKEVSHLCSTPMPNITTWLCRRQDTHCFIIFIYSTDDIE